jgi:cytochrome c553
MTKTPNSKPTKVEQKPKKPVADELRDDDLQQVSAGLAASRPAAALDPVCISKLS